jgi:hypothetical protein
MPARKPAAWLLGVLAVSAVGCGSASDDRPPTWSYIWPAIIQPSCATASCHSAVAARAGVVLEGRETAWQTLTTRHFVIPNDTMGESEILQLMRATAVRRMPPDFPLPPADIQLIERWIEMGAMDN